MNAVPIELPIRGGDAAILATLIFQSTEGGLLRENLRNRIGAQLSSSGIESMRPSIGSLANDPIHPSAYFIAVDALASGKTFLLRIAAASTPASALFPNPLLIGRMRAGLGPEVVINAIPFSASDHDDIRKYIHQVDQAFLPRPHGYQPPFSVASRRPEAILPGAFEAFRYLLRNRGINYAAIAAPDISAGTLRSTASAAAWAAIRAGWREGYTLEAGPFTAADAPMLAGASDYSTFIAGPDLEDEIARLKGRDPWKRFSPDPEVQTRTQTLSAGLEQIPASEAGDAILEFASQ